MNLPPEFISNIQNTFREEGHAFLESLPDLIAEASARWGLTDAVPAPELSYNFVAFAKTSFTATPQGGDKITKHAKIKNGLRDLSALGGSTDVVLKMGVPNGEIRSEMAALKLFNGEGACKLLEYDEKRCWMLLERLRPGVMLVGMEDDEERTHIAAEVMKKIWVSVGTQSSPKGDIGVSLPDNFIQLTDWFHGAFERMRKTFNGGTGPFNQKIVERVESSVRDFFAENHNPVLMHGDFHHYNILSSERGWLVIDPKGVIGPAGYEVGPFMLNPWSGFSDGVNYKSMIKKRIDTLHEHLGFERERILEWSLAHAILSSWWSFEDNTGWESASRFAKILSTIK
ncbi:MAG TPA: aminoglycoside phosphotransferase family protein [Anaerolineales bacterium]|nr:aminoglycoside phosphotransferase family protein [Anaerolineales bacterium]